MIPIVTDVTWSPLISLHRLGLALAVGMFVGLEREWRGKEAGLRTFGFAALFGGIGGLLSDAFALLSVTLLAIPIGFLNVQAMRERKDTELTTSIALFLTGITGVLCGRGHTITPAAVAVVTAGLLTWKEWLSAFSHKLTVEELRSAILLAILTFAIFPLLSENAIDPWGLIVPRTAWLTVILIAAIGFVNYLLWKLFGTRGIELTGFLGGLVNSTVTVTELATNVKRTEGRIADVAFEGILLATGAMALRNAVLLGLLAISAVGAAIVPLVVLTAVSFGLALIYRREVKPLPSSMLAPPLESPFSLWSALKFGGLFLLLEAASGIAQSQFGHLGVYGISLIGGMISSASATASVGALVAAGKLAPATAGIAVVLASLSSAGVNVFLVYRFSNDRRFSRRVMIAMLLISALSVAAALGQEYWSILRWVR